MRRQAKHSTCMMMPLTLLIHTCSHPYVPLDHLVLPRQNLIEVIPLFVYLLNIPLLSLRRFGQHLIFKRYEQALLISVVGTRYKVAAILTNLHTILKGGNKISLYFGCGTIRTFFLFWNFSSSTLFFWATPKISGRPPDFLGDSRIYRMEADPASTNAY